MGEKHLDRHSDDQPQRAPAPSAPDPKPGPEARRHAPATARNRDPIAAVLRDLLPQSGTVLELASGTGEHAAYFASRFPGLVWQPSDPDPQLRRSIEAHRLAVSCANLRAPLDIDVTAPEWPLTGMGAAPAVMVCINMIHIAPWAAAEGLFAGAGRHLGANAGAGAAGGGLFLYGPFKRDGVHTAPSNEAFDRSLRAQDPAWGVRDLGAVSAMAMGAGLAPPEVFEMPANNLALWFAKAPETDTTDAEGRGDAA
ncbi:MAG TPA: DUF938 domain-containing protein [Kiloniellaceae bacterium]|nr:DUF938 domain-containing protein [Kiloniellaceae bacterium]HIP78095.1 DUF938 domain-containing protein [Kiloniellaceae bacterium]